MKTEVFILAKQLGVILTIQNAAPTDGLWEDDRSDEDQLGATYEELEWAMNYIQRKEKKLISDRQKIVLEIYQKLNRNNLHKMEPIPVCVIPNKFK
jgi:NAD+ synthase